jgi:outer membrane protein
MKLKITILFIAFISTFSIAQTKVGTIDSDYVMGLMPEAKIVLKRSQAYSAKLDSSFTIKVQKIQAKIEDFKKNEKEMGELMKKTMIKEISEEEQDIKKYQTNGNKLMQLKQNELMRPLYKMLSEAINSVAKENGYSQILTTTGNQFAYLDQKFDITKLVMAKLGIKEPEVKN